MLAEYMETRLGIPKTEVALTCQRLYIEYGTTVAGLVVRILLVDN